MKTEKREFTLTICQPGGRHRTGIRVLGPLVSNKHTAYHYRVIHLIATPAIITKSFKCFFFYIYNLISLKNNILKKLLFLEFLIVIIFIFFFVWLQTLVFNFIIFQIRKLYWEYFDRVPSYLV